MAMGRRKRERQEELFVATAELAKSPGHPFYRKLNELLAEAGFDRWVEQRCRQYYAEEESRGQPSLPPGVYFRMLLVGYFEGIDSQRGIAWRCADSLGLRQFLGVTLSEATPDHSTLSRTRQRLPLEVFDEVFQFVLRIAAAKKLLAGQTVGVDSTTLEASAAMKSIVRRDTGEDWKGYVARLMKEEGAVAADAEPTDEEIRRFDKKRKNKKVSNDQWESPTDPDARIAKMKDGRTHLAYKAEHVVDLTSELILAAEVYTADQTDHGTLVDSVMQAQVHLNEAGVEATIQGVAADKGYHAAEQIELAETLGFQNVHSRAPAEAQLAVDRQAAGTEGGRVRQSPADWAGQEQEAPAAALRTGGTKLRPRVRLGWHAPQLAERTGGSRQTLPPGRRCAQPGGRDAKPVQDRQAASLAGPSRASDERPALRLRDHSLASTATATH